MKFASTIVIEVFLSSVGAGLEPYRDAVYEAIEGLDGYHCVRMEGFGARNAESETVCRDRVRGCNLFVGILGPEYGSVVPGTEVSFCELEYETALAAGLTRIFFFASDDFPVKTHSIGSDEMRRKQREFRERVQSDRQVAYFTNSDNLGTLVLQAIKNCTEDLARKVAVGAAALTAKTWLLFPYVTTQSGFDTGLAISNVSLDPIGTTPRGGIVRLHFYGSNRPAQVETSIVPPGEVFSGLLSSILSSCRGGFSGYLVTECFFYPGRGYAIISDLGIQNVATSYLAEIIKTEVPR